jgi:hypothetical protein
VIPTYLATPPLPESYERGSGTGEAAVPPAPEADPVVEDHEVGTDRAFTEPAPSTWPRWNGINWGK